MSVARVGGLVCVVVGLLGSCSEPSTPPQTLSKLTESSLPVKQQVIEAAILGDMVRLKTLVASDPALVNVYDDDRRTPLHFAAAHGQNDIVKYLLEKGADPFMEDSEGNRPQATAVDWGHLDTAKIINEAIDDSKFRQAGR